MCSEYTYQKCKEEEEQKTYLDKDPVVSLGKLKRCSGGQNVIRNIGYDPFFVYFWSNHQINVYNKKITEHMACLSIDATGKIAKPIVHADGTNSQHLFLYCAVLHCSGGQFPVSQMVSESQTTVAICSWLKQWIHSGAEFPKEVVSILCIISHICYIFIII